MNIDSFINSVTSSTHSKTKIKRAITLFLNFLQKRGLQLKDAKLLMVQDFRSFLDGIDNPAFQVTARTALKKLAESRNELWALPNEPIHVERRAMAEVRQRILSDMELDILNRTAAQLSAREQALFYVFRDTGLNYTEFLALRVSDIQPSFIRVKGINDRLLPLSSEADNALKAYLSERGHVSNDETLWIGAKGPLTSHRVSVLLRDMSRNLDKPITIMDLRHTFALSLFRQGESPEDVMRLLGLRSYRQLSNLAYALPYLK